MIDEREKKNEQATIRNETPCNLELKGAEGRKLLLSPLEERQIAQNDLDGFFDLSEAKRDGLINQLETETPSEALGTTLTIGFFAVFGLVIACSALSGLTQPPFLKAIWQLFVWSTGVAVLFLIVGISLLTLTKKWSLVLALLAQTVSFIFILAIGLGLPALTIYFFGEGKALLAQPSGTLFARLLQVGFIGTASLLPVLLFFLFDRYQLSTMRNRLYRDLFRLDQSLHKRSEIDGKYGPQIREKHTARKIKAEDGSPAERDCRCLSARSS